MLNNTAPYRRDDHGTLKVPVVMPLVEVVVTSDGYLDIRLDREPCTPDGAATRRDLAAIVKSISDDLGAPVRVEVHEGDGNTYTDIVTPSDQANEQRAADHVPPATATNGFLPDEEVSVAVILGQHRHGADSLENRLPPTLLATHRGNVVLLGRTSGTVRVVGE